MEGGIAGWPGDCVWGGMTGEAAGGTEGGAGEGLPVGWGGISFCGALDGAAAFTIGPRIRKKGVLFSSKNSRVNDVVYMTEPLTVYLQATV